MAWYCLWCNLITKVAALVNAASRRWTHVFKCRFKGMDLVQETIKGMPDVMTDAWPHNRDTSAGIGTMNNHLKLSHHHKNISHRRRGERKKQINSCVIEQEFKACKQNCHAISQVRSYRLSPVLERDVENSVLVTSSYFLELSTSISHVTIANYL